MLANDKKLCSIYVSSWDGYSDLWTPFFQCFWKSWPDCPYPVYLGTNSRDFSDSRVKPLKSPEFNNWSDRTLEHLKQIDSKYVLMILEDFFLKRTVDTKRIAGLIGYLERLDGHAVRLVPDPKPTYALTGQYEIGLMGPGAHNRMNTHATIWRRDTLMALIRDGESLWEFEVNGGVRTNKYPGGMFSVWKRAMYYDGVVDKGRWFPWFAWKYKMEGASCDLKTRPAKSIGSSLQFLCSKAVSKSLWFLPVRMRQNLRLLSQKLALK